MDGKDTRSSFFEKYPDEAACENSVLKKNIRMGSGAGIARQISSILMLNKIRFQMTENAKMCPIGGPGVDVLVA